MYANLCHSLQPGIQCITAHSKIRLIKFILLSPSEWSIAKPLLDDGMQPGQQEVEPSSLVRLFAHPWSWYSAECTNEVGFHTRWRLKGEDTRAPEEIDWHLQRSQKRNLQLYIYMCATMWISLSIVSIICVCRHTNYIHLQAHQPMHAGTLFMQDRLPMCAY